MLEASMGGLKIIVFDVLVAKMYVLDIGNPYAYLVNCIRLFLYYK